MKIKEDRVYSTIIFVIAIIFYLFFAFFDGVIISADTPTYVEMSITREFFYPTLLAISRFLFGEQYLFAIVILQSILAAYVAWNSTIFFKKQFQLNNIYTGLVFLMPIMVSLLNRFVARRGSMYSNTILTEGIAIPLFLLFFRYVYEYIIKCSTKALVISGVITGVLISTRKQMYVALILLFFAVVYVNIVSNRKSVKNTVKASAKAFFIAVSLLIITSLLDHTYNYVVRGRFVGHSSDSRFVLTMVFYASEEEYAELLPEELRPLFLDIYERCDSQGYLMHSADEGWYNNVVHFGDCYDPIQINTMWPTIQEHAEKYSAGDNTERQLITDEITNEMITHLMPKTAPRIIKVLFNNVLSGLVTTIAQRNQILIYYSIIAYLGYVILLGAYWKRVGRIDETVALCLLTLLSIVVNVGLVSAVIFCQTRYTIYNMPIFYISALVLLVSIYRLQKKKTS